MFKNYFKTGIRNLWRNKSNSFLNVFGLAIGIACAGMIFLWIEDEMSFDNSFAKRNEVYRVIENQTYDGKVRTFNSTPGPLAAAMKAEIPGVVNACRLSKKEILFNLADKSLYEKGCYADSGLFSIFSLNFLQGNPKQAFSELYNVVISQKVANQFFPGEKNIIGKTLKLDNNKEFAVSGVIEDIPENSTLKFDWIAPFEIFVMERDIKGWGNNWVDTYAELSPLANVKAADKQLNGFIEKKSGNKGTSAFLFAMKDWHLRDNFEDGKQTGGRITYVRMFAVIAWIILLIACINFMNLATARSEKRAREVGVRKVLGASRKKLILQFIGEAVLMSGLAVILGIGAVALFLPTFNVLVEKQLVPALTQPLHIIALLMITLLCGLFAGSYPAFYLSSFNPVSVFKGLKLKNGSAAFIRKGLVVLQFTISIILIISTVIIYNQVQHVKNRDLGYNKDHLITMKVRGEMARNFQAIKQDMLNTGVVENVAINSYETLSIGNNTSGSTWKGKDPSKDVLISKRFISPEFISTAGMEIVEGRDFVSTATDSNNILITKSLATVMGKETALGKTIQFRDRQFQVVGIVKDFVYGDMYGKSDPVAFFCLPNDARYMYVRIKASAHPQDALAKLESVMKKDNAAYPFEFSFVDDQFNDRFKSEMLIGKLSRVFAILAILISCLGLFGLSAYTAERRTKEIGIRKVLGASTAAITGLLSKDFLLLVSISTVIAFPLAWWAMSRWLENYAYRISISWWIFIAAGMSAMLIALLTVSFQAIRAAIANPVKSLRTE